jgi:hypothetical protein
MAGILKFGIVNAELRIEKKTRIRRSKIKKHRKASQSGQSYRVKIKRFNGMRGIQNERRATRPGLRNVPVIIYEEDILTVISPLCYMMSTACNNNSRASWHNAKLAEQMDNVNQIKRGASLVSLVSRKKDSHCN